MQGQHRLFYYLHKMIIIPSGLLDTIVQSSGGTTVQNGYGGLQLHKKAYQRKVKSSAQQAQRNNFTVAQTGWADLTPTQQATWYAAATPPQSGFELYSSTNNKLVASGLTIIPEYVMPITAFNPTLTNSLINYEVLDGMNRVQANWSCSFDEAEIDTNGWTFFFKWTGWINGSAYRYPDPRLAINIGSISIGSSSGIVDDITVVWTSVPDASPGPINLLQKTKITMGWINAVTGQVSTGDTFEIKPA